MTTYTYQEKAAINVLRKAMVTKPEIAQEILRGVAKEAIYGILKQAAKEMADLHAATQALVAASKHALDNIKE